MVRYLLIAALAGVGGYAWGLADGLATIEQLAPMVLGQMHPY